MSRADERTCSICGRVPTDREPVLVIENCLEPDHRLFRYCGTAMHESCFSAWPELKQFEADAHAFLSTPERTAEYRRARAEKETASARAVERHNRAHARVMKKVREHGAGCPHCGARTSDFRELPGSAHVWARVVCKACARSCDADALILT